MNTVCIIQARMGSERLPGKVLQLIEGSPMIERVVERAARSRLLDSIVIATTNQPQDDLIAEFCVSRGWNYFRGNENDVLDRYYYAAREADADHVVRVTSDCPLIDPKVLDYVIASYQSAAPVPDYASNITVRSYPRGLDAEIFSFAALERAWNEDKSRNWREHVTPYLYQNPDKFRLLHVTNRVDFSNYRITVDTQEDLELARQIYRHFGSADVGWREIVQALDEHPEWVSINQDVAQKPLSQ